MSTKKESPPGILVLHKALNILDAVKESSTGTGLTDLARSLSMPKATVYRIVVTLLSRGYIEQTSTGAYRICRKMFSLPSLEEMDEALVKVSKSLIAELSLSCQETVNLGLIDSAEVVVISTAQSPQSVRMSSKVGNRRYLHSTALGKVLLASMPDEEVGRLITLKGLPAVTKNTITSKLKFMQELATIREQGYAIDDQENELQGRCIGAPIRGVDGSVVAALSISGPEFRMSMKRTLSLVQSLKATCARISKALS